MYPEEAAAKGKKPTAVDGADAKTKAAAKAPDFSDVSSKADLNTLAKSALGSSQNQSLVNIKQQALEKLGPLVDNLEQSPEQHFRTLMMIIQETDNVDLLDKAYATALQLKDAKERAQALLAVANEINYFTSQ